MQNKTVNIVTLGCSKNLVDSEYLLKQLESKNYTTLHDSSEKAEIVIINTCGFILDAKEESIETILDYCEAKKQGLVEKIFVIGCLSEKYKDELQNELPEVDKFYGKFDFMKVLNALNKNYDSKLETSRQITTPNHYAYLKISEGCNRTCSFCAIPHMTGIHKSKPIDLLIDEAMRLSENGVKELLVIAQDLSYYGLDLYKKNSLAKLINSISDIKSLAWIKLHYLYPSKFPYEILDVIKERPNVCRYMDIALQHISDNMLKAMRRNTTKKETLELIDKIRTEIPGIALRTTLMTGHPGETEQDFDELKDFVKQARFERLGVFAYSHEENTYAYKNYPDDIEQEVKEARRDEIMEIQQNISAKIQKSKIGTEMHTIVDRKEGDYYVGRTEFDSPEVDGEVLIKHKEQEMTIGDFYNIKITDADDYDLYGELKP